MLSKQKRLELNLSVRNAVRFVAYFLSDTSYEEGSDEALLSFGTLLEFNVGDEVDDPDEDYVPLADYDENSNDEGMAA